MLGNLNIRKKLIFIQVGVVFFTLLLVGIILLIYQNKSLKDNKVANLSSIGSIMAYNVIPVLQFKDPTSGKEILSTLRSEKLIDYATMYDAAGNRFCEYIQEGKVIETEEKKPKYDAPQFSKNQLIIQVPIVANGDLLGTIQICTRLDDINATFEYYIYVYALSFLLILVFALIVANIFQKVITSPIQKILNTVRSISTSKLYSERIDVIGNDEISLLAMEFNTMIYVIDEHNTRLEAKINERTESLKTINAKLKTQIETVNKFIKEQKDFTYVASHDLKTPIRSIASLANFIEDDLGDNAPAEIKDHLKMIHLKANKLQNIIDGVLTFLRIDKEKEKSKELNFDEFITFILNQYDSNQNIEITYKDKIGLISTQYDALKRIITQLIDNAITFNDKDNKEIAIQCEKRGSSLIIKVSDNGVGIEEKYFEKIFEPFRYLSNQKNTENIGLGLSLINKLIQLNGGDINVTSNLNKGTTFEIAWKLH